MKLGENVRNYIYLIKILRDDVLEKEKQIKKDIKHITKKVEKEINKIMKDFDLIVHCSVAFDCGYMSKKWKPEIFVYGSNYLETGIIYYSKNKKWYKVIREEDDFSDKSIFEIPPQVNMKKLREMIKVIKQKTGVNTRLVGGFNYIIKDLIEKGEIK